MIKLHACQTIEAFRISLDIFRMSLICSSANLRIIPLIDKEAVFALKGGTAINFFARDLPRISVDIDLVYLPIGERDLSLRDISATLVRISRDVESRIPGTKVFFRKIKGTDFLAVCLFNDRRRWMEGKAL
jgi:hypothetical protein